MISGILEGPKAVDTARILIKSNMVDRAFDLGPDFGQVTARIFSIELHTFTELRIEFDRFIAERWIDPEGWILRMDGPPYKGDGEEVSVVGAEIQR
jgi:hypothetical protein